MGHLPATMRDGHGNQAPAERRRLETRRGIENGSSEVSAERTRVRATFATPAHNFPRAFDVRLLRIAASSLHSAVMARCRRASSCLVTPEDECEEEHNPGDDQNRQDAAGDGVSLHERSFVVDAVADSMSPRMNHSCTMPRRMYARADASADYDDASSVLRQRPRNEAQNVDRRSELARVGKRRRPHARCHRLCARP